jgi:hypothetical protein
MRYYQELVVPAGTPVTAPTILEIKLTPGTIDHVSLYFPPSSGGFLNVQLWLNGYQLVPWERGQWLRGDDVLIPDYGRYDVQEEPYLLTVKGWSTATLFAHRALVSVELTPYQIVAFAAPDTSLQEMRYD